MKLFEYCVCIGSFQPFHHAHHELIREAFSYAETVLVVIGGAESAPNLLNPFSATQREEMIMSALSDDEKLHVKFLHVRNYYYNNNRWLTKVQQLVYNATNGINDSKICNIGEYSRFPQWKLFKMRNLDRMPQANVICALICGFYFTHDNAYKSYVSSGVVDYLESFKLTQSFKNLKEEYDYVRKYQASWNGAPFPPTFVTVNCVVIKSGHVLAVRRKVSPGRHLIALPGGFLNHSETILDGALRELKEETGIKLPKEELGKAITEAKVFDYPERSIQERTITHAFLIDLGDGHLPLVKGSDDADKAWWMSFRDFNTRENEFFEDHFYITSHFINKF